MKIFPSFRYQVAEQKKAILVYYLVLVSMFCVMGLLLLVPDLSDGGTMFNGLTATTAIFAFILSLCSFKENFGMALQNGVTRRSLFLGRLCATAAVCAILAVADEILVGLTSLISWALHWNIISVSMFQAVYGDVIGEVLHPALLAVCSAAFNFFMLLAASALGYFITILFYRLNKLGKVLVGAGVPFFFLIGVPLLKMLSERIAGGKIGEAVVAFLAGMVQLMMGEPQNAMLTCLGAFALISALAWLLLRRAVVK